jgi:hypothetical protein
MMASLQGASVRTNTNITVYNQYIDSSTRQPVFQRTQIGVAGSFAVAWENRKAVNVLRSGLIHADSATVYIPLSCGANHLDPIAWLAAKHGKWTLQAGDIIVKGLVTDEITALIPAHGTDPIIPAVPAFTPTLLKAKYDDVLIITSVDPMMSGSYTMRHWRVGAQ